MANLDITKPLENVFLNGELWEKSNGQAPYAWKRTSYEMVDVTDEVNDNKKPLDAVVVSSTAKNVKWYASRGYVIEDDHFKFDEAQLAVITNFSGFNRQFVARTKCYIYVDKIQDETDSGDIGIPNQTSKYLIEVPADCYVNCKRYGVDDAGNLNAQYPEKAYITVPNAVGINGRVTVYTVQPKIEYVVDINPNKYPEDGEQDGYWYEKVSSEFPYAWGKYIVDSENAINETSVTDGGTTYCIEGNIDSCTVYLADTYTYDKTTSTYTLVNPTENASITKNYTSGTAITSVKYFMINETSGAKMFYSGGKSGTNYVRGYWDDNGVYVKCPSTAQVYKIYTTILKPLYIFSEFMADKNPLKYPNGEVADDGYFYRYVNEGGNVWRKNSVTKKLVEGVDNTLTTLPYSFTEGKAVVYKGEIHIIGGSQSVSGATRNHYKYSNGEWVVASALPYAFNYGGAVVYNDEIHILGSTISGNYNKHYKWDGVSWTSVSTLPYNYQAGGCIVHDGKIHILGSSYGGQLEDSTYYWSLHFSWDGESWFRETDMPGSYYNMGCVSYNNAIHILGNNGSPGWDYHYKWSGDEWTQLNNTPYHFRSGRAIVFENQIHILSGRDNVNGHAVWTEENDVWTTKKSIPVDISINGEAVVDDDGIHALKGTSHFLIDGYDKIYNYLCSIVSDNENAYPSNAEEDGYYYKKVIDNFTWGQCTPISSNVLEIEHNMGRTPDWFFVFSPFHQGQTYVIWAVFYDNKTNPSQCYLLTYTGGFSQSAQSFSTDEANRRSTSTAYFGDNVFTLPGISTSYTYPSSYLYTWACGFY